MAKNPNENARQLQRVLYCAAKRSRSRRFHALYDKVYRMDILERAWHQVKTNRGTAGVDGQTIAAIEDAGVSEMLTELQAQLRAGRYRPLAVKRVYIPKTDGKKRPLGIPAIRDRVVQAALKIVIEPIFEADFLPSSFGFRPKRSAHQAVERIRQTANQGYNVVLDADIQAYFDTIDHTRLLALVKQRISDRRVLKLIGKFLKAGILEEGKLRNAVAGTPQGGVISPLLSNIYLHYLDKVWTERCGHLGVLVRYCDDCAPRTHGQEVSSMTD